MFAAYSSTMNMFADAACAPACQSARKTSVIDAALLWVVSFLLEEVLCLAVRIRLPGAANRRT